MKIENRPSAKEKKVLKDFLRSFLVPTLIGKGFILYFGIMLADNPDQGYGYGLTVAIIFTVTSLFLFAWKYRNHEEL